MNRIALALAAALLAALPLRAADPLDNSFLIEEAFNLDQNVAHYLFTVAGDGSGAYSGAFTHEWTAGASRAQLAYTVPVDRAGSFALTGRYQLAGGERSAVTPRLSLLLPANGGGWGFDVNLPASVVFSDRVAVHANAGLTRTDALRVSGGASLVTAPFDSKGGSKLHLLLEARAMGDVVTVAPGVRWGFDCRNGMRIVPGIGFALGSDRSRGLYVTFSVEQPRS